MSGTTPFTLACVREARRRGALTVGIANNRSTPVIDEADQGIFLDAGAEPVAGSTRMNAGTAQRVTLNLLSTLVMIRLGRIYRGMMVDVQSTNVKLRKRKTAMVGYLTGTSDEEARRGGCGPPSSALPLRVLQDRRRRGRTRAAAGGGTASSGANWFNARSTTVASMTSRPLLRTYRAVRDLGGRHPAHGGCRG